MHAYYAYWLLMLFTVHNYFYRLYVKVLEVVILLIVVNIIIVLNIIVWYFQGKLHYFCILYSAYLSPHTFHMQSFILLDVYPSSARWTQIAFMWLPHILWLLKLLLCLSVCFFIFQYVFAYLLYWIFGNQVEGSAVYSVYV